MPTRAGWNPEDVQGFVFIRVFWIGTGEFAFGSE
jgi:hypothetical protein